ncbi:MAG TPA: hypothetical protein DDX39_11230 [Bacteroidales bacterium]|nr:MAG: hypothetical protein A2W98_13825 [Bacteroidetes bacterium GWF2_33_38]OFY90988.1 MAG: hypothetical protein A2236_03460 [Bacteroidetes bacterium RIFOXYA2_FULL_33_7]HBF89204.1 hypothetical protein [Bacteroidales bacterium]
MKNPIILLFFLIGFSYSIFGQNTRAYLDYASFYNQKTGSYIETYLTIVGSTVKFVKNKNDKYQASVEITMLFKQNDTIRSVDKYTLNSPEIDDTLQVFPNFIDLQRNSLKNGTYIFEFSIRDINTDVKPFIYKDAITVDYNESTFAFSDFEIVEKYSKTENVNVLSKNGYDMVPYVSNFFPENIDKLIYYCELYNSDKLMADSSIFLINYYIENKIDNKPLSDYKLFRKLSPSKLYVHFSEFNIEKLPSGNYNIVLEIRDKENNLLKMHKYNFLRSNPAFDDKKYDYLSQIGDVSFVDLFTSADTLREHLRSLRPISDNFEVIFAENQIKGDDIQTMRNFFYGFWKKRNAESPYQAWLDYYKNVRAVNEFYNTAIKKGYETDRGRVYLQYGPPNTINEEKYETSSYPYEIWQYNEIAGKTNRKFLFYNPDLVDDDYVLLHSDMPGEISNKNWQMHLHKRDVPFYNHDQENVDDYYGNQSKILFDNPR